MSPIWTSVRDIRVVSSNVNCRWNYDSGQLEFIRNPLPQAQEPP